MTLRAPSPRQAFSMIELMVAMAVLVILAMIANQMISSTSQVVGEGRKRFKMQTKARAALDLIARDVANGIYRDDLGAFVDAAGQPALALFTRRAGTVAPNSNPGDYRRVSFVAYRSATDADLEDASLWRGIVHLEWSDAGSHPAVPSSAMALPFSPQALPAAYETASRQPVLEPVLDGVARLDIRFLGTDGKFRRSYNRDSSTGPTSKAVAVSLLVMDDDTKQFLAENSGFQSAVEQALLAQNSRLPTPEESDLPLGTLWLEKLDDQTTWEGIPPRIRGGMHVYERIIPIR